MDLKRPFPDTRKEQFRHAYVVRRLGAFRCALSLSSRDCLDWQHEHQCACFSSLRSGPKNFTWNSGLPVPAPSLQAAHLAAAFQHTSLASATIVAVHNQGVLTLADQTSSDH